MEVIDEPHTFSKNRTYNISRHIIMNKTVSFDKTVNLVIVF